jgi:glutaminyl-tRNA synthetase
MINCPGAVRHAAGNITEVHAKLISDTKSGTPGSDAIKVEGVITWWA